ncbi:MAG: triose-phosphate isomerase [Bacillota bacterium]|nr:triose-phosphate isomerase [Bacillota bacterium]
MRKPFFAANWKMHKLQTEAQDFMKEFVPEVADLKAVDIVICPPFTALLIMNMAVQNSNISLGAQNLFWEEKGAYTGEIAPSMLTDSGCGYVIIGHSERRSVIGENNTQINRKIKAALSAGLIPIFCVGETLQERENQMAREVVKEQMQEGLKEITFSSRGLVVAYEPVWAIGTGVNASPDDAQEMCRFIRECLSVLYDENTAQDVPVLYGGSVKPANTEQLMLKEDIDGALVGGASLNPSDFAKIVRLGING